MLTLQDLYVYPIKGLGGQRLTRATVTLRGLQHDRRWMLVDANGRFITQREQPRLALLEVHVAETQLRITPKLAESIPPLCILTEAPRTPAEPVVIWQDTVAAQPVGPEADAWFSQYLGQPVRLVYLPDASPRQVDRRFAPEGQHVSLADGYPFLVISQASLDDLNSRLPNPLPMNRFRPNLVVSGGEPYQEDFWKMFTVGGVSFMGVKPCGRCTVITVDQQTAETGKEPLRTLASYRRNLWGLGENNIYFGMNLLAAEAGGILQVGDAIHVQQFHETI